MRFRTGGGLDSSQVEDRRGGGGPLVLGGGGLGLVGIVVYLLFALLGGGSAGTYGGLDGITVAQPQAPSQSLGTECGPGVDINSVQKYWSGWFAAHGKPYTQAKTVFFTGSTTTGCGDATTDVGPFYCPVDKHVYLDLDFFNELHTRFGARGGPFAQAYVVAHEYGHHVQDLQGILDRVGDTRDTGPQSPSVRTELQADCYAGVWARHAVATGYITQLTQQDVAEGLDAAAAVGDDRIQSETQGQVNPETWRHGSSAERQKWFSRGYQRGEPTGCNTFSGSL